MLSMWVKSLRCRPVNIFLTKNTYSFNNYQSFSEQDADTSSRQRRDYFNNRKLFKSEMPSKNADKNLKKQNQNETNVEEFVKTINQINKEFLGIKQNTDYFKVYNQKSFEEICKPDKSQFFKINDLPFAVKSKSNPIQTQSNETKQHSLPNNAAVKMLNHMITHQKLTKQLERLAKTYFSDLLAKERKSRMEPNFEAYSRKVIETLKASKWNFRLSNQDSNPKVVLKNVTLLKGVKVNRNDNYTVDSYQVNLDEAEQGITTYTLWKKQREQYPEEEWFAQRFIVARIEAEVSNCPTIEVSEENQMQSSTKGLNHQFVFEVDLSTPPSLSYLSLSAQEYLNSYRMKPQKIYITNVDNRNVWFNMAYKEEEKKFKLINKII